MKSPICSICLNSDILCTACKEKVDSGLISENNLEILRKINKAAKGITGLENVEIKKVLDTRRVLILICGKDDVEKLVGKGGVIVKKLGRSLDRIIRVVEESDNMRDFLQNLIFPVPILSVGDVYTQEGEKIRVRIPAGKQLPISPKIFSQIAKDLFKKDVELVQEGEVKEETTEEKIKRLMKKIER